MARCRHKTVGRMPPHSFTHSGGRVPPHIHAYYRGRMPPHVHTSRFFHTSRADAAKCAPTSSRADAATYLCVNYRRKPPPKPFFISAHPLLGACPSLAAPSLDLARQCSRPARVRSGRVHRLPKQAIKVRAPRGVPDPTFESPSESPQEFSGRARRSAVSSAHGRTVNADFLTRASRPSSRASRRTSSLIAPPLQA